MGQWKATWYDMHEIKHVETEPIVGSTIEEAEQNAYRRYNGKPPAEFLMLEELGAKE